MIESENSWNIEDLVSQMEVMQKENESLNLLLNQKEEQIQQLSSEISEMQSVLPTLKNELQKKSDQIVKLNSADLILKENVMLKEKDRQRLKELNRAKTDAETEVRACKNDYNAYKAVLDRNYDERFHDLKNKFDNENKALRSDLNLSIIYSALVTLLSAMKSTAFVADFMDFFESVKNIAVRYLAKVSESGESAAEICENITSPVARDIIHQLIASLASASIIIITGIVLILLMSGYTKWYKKKISDNISVLITTFTLLVTIFLADEIKVLLPVNLITINLIVQLLYNGIRAYILADKS